MRVLLVSLALIVLLFLLPAALFGSVALLVFGLLGVMVAGLLALATTSVSEISGDVIFTNGVPARTVLMGGDLGSFPAGKVVRAEKVLHGDLLVIRVTSKSGAMAKFWGRTNDPRIEAVLEWLLRKGIAVEQRGVGSTARAGDKGPVDP